MKKLLSITLSITMLLSLTAGLSFTAYAADGYQGVNTQASELNTGDTFQMGNYPQSEVKDESLISALNDISCTLTNYGYMQNSNASSHTYDAVDMSYADINYGDSYYRKVVIKEFRPYWTQNSNSSGTYQYQDENGFTTGNTYYFKWEPIVWQVLAKESDGIYVMSKTLLDSQAYNNYYESTTWENCSLRSWLNNYFYKYAFSSGEMANIVTTTNKNENNPYYGTEGGNDTTDNLWILSYSDAINSAYGFSGNYSDCDTARRAQGSDYAKSQGLGVSMITDYKGNSVWWLRTPGAISGDAAGVDDGGYANDDYSYVNYTYYGIRPAFKLSLNSEVCKTSSANSQHIGNNQKNNEETGTNTNTAANESNPPANINPAPAGADIICPTLKKPKAGKKRFTATWSAVNGATGYEVQYSTNKKFKKAKTKKLKASKTKVTIKKLKVKKTYFVRVRAIGANGAGAWSKAKKVKVK